jgi:uncharacterized protein (TIGR02145 family)
MKQHIKMKWWMGCALGMLSILSACSSDSSTGSANGSGTGESSYLNPNIIYGTLSDSRDGQVYYTVVIGTQTWMAENLNYAVDSSWCYNNSADSCSKYGRLYQWAAAMALPAAYNNATWGGNDANHQGVCPTGWHIPTDAEWTILTNAVGGEDVAGTAFKSSSGWDIYSGANGNGTDNYGFSALPAGFRYGDDGSFDYVGRSASFWSATEYDWGGDAAYNRFLRYDVVYMHADGNEKFDATPVRCLKN